MDTKEIIGHAPEHWKKKLLRICLKHRLIVINMH